MLGMGNCPRQQADPGIGIALRPCVVRGAPWTLDSQNKPVDGSGSATVDARTIELIDATTAIWQPGAGIGFYLAPINFNGAHVPIIEDPYPPGTSSDIDPNGGPRKLGDIEQEDDRTSAESELVVQECNAAWGQQFPSPQPGIPVVIAANLVRRDGGFQQKAGFSPPIISIYLRNDGKDICDLPRNLTREDVNNRYVILSAKSDSAQLPLAHTLAHEIGHVFLLNHGDGVDNDNNGRWDAGCDQMEYDTFEDGIDIDHQSLMNVTPFVTTITPLQRQLARTSALLIDGAISLWQ